jgi:hypothetical protein
MASLRRVLPVLALAALTLGVGQRVRGDTISSGGYTVGIFRDSTTTPVAGGVAGGVYGTLIDATNTQIGYRNPSGFDPFGAMGLNRPRDAFGLSVSGPGISVSGYADPLNVTANGGIHNIQYTPNPPPVTAGSPVTGLLLNGATPIVQIGRTFNFVPGNSNVLDVRTTLTNLTAVPLAMQFRNLTEFPLVNGQTLQDSTIANIPAPRGFVTGTSPFVYSNTAGNAPISADPTQPFIPASGTFSPPGAYGALVNLNLGTVAAFPGTPTQNDFVTFDLFYATAAPNESAAQLQQQLLGLGINFQLSGTNAATDIFGAPPGFNTGVVGLIIPPPIIPEPGTVALFGLGVASLAGWRLRRKASA